MHVSMESTDPQERLAQARKEFGEWGGVNASIEVSTTFTVLDAGTMPAMFTGVKTPDNSSCYVYGRSFNPTVRYLGRQLAAMEGTEAGYACSSGMGAISSTFLALCNTGDHIVASNTVYGGTHAFLKHFLPKKSGITTTFVDISDLDAVAAAITPRTKVLYTETVSNPTLVVADLPALAAIAHAQGVKLVVDNTFTPLVISPAKWGADVVIHSLTKFISGASDIIAGAVCGTSHLINQMMDLQMGPLMLLGPTMDPKVASELSLRIPHLSVRITEHSRRAAALAARLKDLGAQVNYPGLPDHPQHAILARLVNPGYGFGGIFGLDLGSQHLAERLMERLQNVHGFGLMAVSLGYFDTLLSCSAASTSSELSAEDLVSAHIAPAYVRISVGITGTLEQRWEQLKESYLDIVAQEQATTGVNIGKAPFSALAKAHMGSNSADSDYTAKDGAAGPPPRSPTPASDPTSHPPTLPSATAAPSILQPLHHTALQAQSSGVATTHPSTDPAPGVTTQLAAAKARPTSADIQQQAQVVKGALKSAAGEQYKEGQGSDEDVDTPQSKRARLIDTGRRSFNNICSAE